MASLSLHTVCTKLSHRLQKVCMQFLIYQFNIKSNLIWTAHKNFWSTCFGVWGDTLHMYNRSRTFEEEKFLPEPVSIWSGNGQGGSNRRPHQDTSRESMRSRNFQDGFSRWDRFRGSSHHRGRDEFSRNRYQRPEMEDRMTRRNYKREQPSTSVSKQPPNRRRY